MSKKEIANALLDFSLGATVLAINNINIGVNIVLPIISPTIPNISTTNIPWNTLIPISTTTTTSTTTVDPWPPL